jgi:hypothetical protein
VSGRRVAYILVDALRYELGVALHAQLAETDQAELQPACAQLPTVTPVGMASLLPGAAMSAAVEQARARYRKLTGKAGAGGRPAPR